MTHPRNIAIPGGKEIPTLLIEHEQKQQWPNGNGSVVEMEFPGHDVIVISDLHIAEGLHSDGRYTGPENFFYDDALARFLADPTNTARPTVLVINGDFVDFLRIIEVPFDKNGIPIMAQMQQWSTLLTTIGWGGDASPAALRGSVSRRQRKLGLGTSAPQSAWKLWLANHGHQLLFQSLASWLARGNQIVITKGNHDLEWYWPEVRNTLRLILAEHIAANNNNPSSIAQALQQVVLGRLHFIDDALLIEGSLYIEHGHRYDRNARVIGPPTLPMKKVEPELNIPFGSFFNRYLLNRIERLHPFMDNVRPTQNVIPTILRENFWLGIKIIFWHIPLLFRLIRGRYYKAYLRALANYVFRRLIWQAAAVFGPVIIAAILACENWRNQFLYWIGITTTLSSGAGDAIISPGVGDVIIRFFLSAYASYLLGQMVSNIQLMGIDSMTDDEGVQALRRRYPIVTMGHTHNPDQIIEANGHAFFNTGTWIPIVQANSAELRVDRTFTFLRCVRNPAGGLVADGLHCWNDDARRPDNQTVLHRE
ncbi:MAG: metallophosphoesterase [Chlorobi bacterium]|nr:metallophosphoesterase [Chlorobiota bacterium]MBX7216927.1 metallophosphoesterase [Candidatus Kapabacteria bacterium]